MDFEPADEKYSPIAQEAKILDGAFQLTKFCLSQCNNNITSACFENCPDKYHNARLLAHKRIWEIIENSFDEKPLS